MSTTADSVWGGDSVWGDFPWGGGDPPSSSVTRQKAGEDENVPPEADYKNPRYQRAPTLSESLRYLRMMRQAGGKAQRNPELPSSHSPMRMRNIEPFPEGMSNVG
jgi:hypothetical protein